MVGGLIAARRLAPVLLVCAHLDEADHAAADLSGLGLDAEALPALEVTPGETGVHPDLLGQRLRVVKRLESDAPPDIVVAPMAALMQPTPSPETARAAYRMIRVGESVDRNELAEWLTGGSWQRVKSIESPGDFAIRGDIIDLFPPGGEPCRIDLFGDEVESLNAIDIGTMGSDRKLEQIELTCGDGASLAAEGGRSPIDALPEGCIVVLLEVIDLGEQGRSYFERIVDGHGIDGPNEVFRKLAERAGAQLDITHFGGGITDQPVTLPVQSLPAFSESATKALDDIVSMVRGGDAVVLTAATDAEWARTQQLLADHAPDIVDAISFETRTIYRGFSWRGSSDASISVVPCHELHHRYDVRHRTARREIRSGAGGRSLDAFVDLRPGDHVVHRDHGIAMFKTFGPLEGHGDDDEFLTLEFAKGSILHVPAARIELVQKYIGGFAKPPELSTFGGKRWKTQKDKVTDAVRELAAEMIRMQAVRAALPGIRYPDDTDWQREFEAAFPYDETEDQVAAINAVKRDMQSTQPMDRLICGDVGFGKTEVAIRAAFKAAEFGKQVAILVPTTVLAEQHERTFRARFHDYPFRVEAISRFRTPAETKKVLNETARGRVDIVIGTHRLLSKDVKFADLGLVIIDEEQRFGVEHKQRLLAFRTTADVLTLSATPIPRTLHMALLGLRDISSLQTAPRDRRPIVTDVIPYDANRVRDAIQRELAREGQVYVVHNRVGDIESVADDIRRLAPDAKIAIGHGQMPSKQLERVMRNFIQGTTDILVATTIIESGIDVARANTMVISDAHIYGLSELHQLRGRVGRSKHRAYCYLLLPRDSTVTEKAMKRLRALESFSMLGSGFRIALKDLELRGAGNFLGVEQSGHIAAVGYEMYCQLLEQAVEDLKRNRTTKSIDTSLELGIRGTIPRGWIPADGRRLDAYRRVSRASDATELAAVRASLESAYGRLPKKTMVLFELAEVRVRASEIGVRSVTLKDQDIIFRTREPEPLETALKPAKGSKRIVGAPQDGIVTLYYRPPANYLEPRSMLRILRTRLAAVTSGDIQ